MASARWALDGERHKRQSCRHGYRKRLTKCLIRFNRLTYVFSRNYHDVSARHHKIYRVAPEFRRSRGHIFLFHPSRHSNGSIP
jgi:hypothetical protein